LSLVRLNTENEQLLVLVTPFTNWDLNVLIVVWTLTMGYFLLAFDDFDELEKQKKIQEKENIDKLKTQDNNQVTTEPTITPEEPINSNTTKLLYVVIILVLLIYKYPPQDDLFW